MVRKVAIFNNEDCIKLLESAKTITDQVRVYLMLAFGMHPENLRNLTGGPKGNVRPEGIIQFTRAKSYAPMRHLITENQAEVIIKIIRSGKLKVNNRTYEYVCKYMGESLPKYQTKPVSPDTLRHTYILNELRRFNCDLHLVSVKAGCHIRTVKQNYLDLLDWERIHQKENMIPLDLSQWIFHVEGDNDEII